MTIDPAKIEKGAARLTKQCRDRDDADGTLHAALPQSEPQAVDLHREGANIQELQARQLTSVTPLSPPSKAAQAVLRQF